MPDCARLKKKRSSTIWRDLARPGQQCHRVEQLDSPPTRVRQLGFRELDAPPQSVPARRRRAFGASQSTPGQARASPSVVSAFEWMTECGNEWRNVGVNKGMWDWVRECGSGRLGLTSAGRTRTHVRVRVRVRAWRIQSVWAWRDQGVWARREQGWMRECGSEWGNVGLNKGMGEWMA